MRQSMLDWLSSVFLLPLENVPLSANPRLHCSEPPCQLISVGPLISTKCSNYAQISWTAKTQEMAFYLPPPHLPTALKTRSAPTNDRKARGAKRVKWGGEIFKRHKVQSLDKTGTSVFLNCFVSLETSPKSRRFLDCESRPLSAFTFCVSLQVCPFFFHPNAHNGIDWWCSWNCCEIDTSLVSAVMCSVSKNVVEDFFFLKKK